MKNLLLFTILFTLTLLAQNAVYAPAPVVVNAVAHGSAPELRSTKMIPPPIAAGKFKMVPNKKPKPFGRLNTQPDNALDVQDGETQTTFGNKLMQAPIANFDGVNNVSGYYPPDTQGDVGPNHYVQCVNSSFAIYSKTGSKLYGPASLKTIWQSLPGAWVGTDDGDPIVLYDQLSDRWLISQFALPNYPNGPFYELVAISKTADPTGGWHLYSFQFTNFPDYPKFGVGKDAYYMSFNMFSNSGYLGTSVAAIERDSMLAGKPARMVFFQMPSNHESYSFLPADLDGIALPTSTGMPYVFYNDNIFGASRDELNLYTFTVNWSNTSLSTFTKTISLPVNSADITLCSDPNDYCVPQKGTTAKLNTLTDRLMYRLQLRQFPTYQSMVTCQGVDVGTGKAGVRWYELRNSGSGWAVHQQGTYSPDANHRWMPSIAMNGSGDIALGYSVSSTTMNPSIYYTGRTATDPLGFMGHSEGVIINGTGSQTTTDGRWGDYSMMSVDPSDDQTFWYTTEYFKTTSFAGWSTRIASFSLSSIVPVELASFTANTTERNSVLLSWVTATELNNKGFEVERLVNGEWDVVGYIDGNGTTTEINSYQFEDAISSNVKSTSLMYRLNQIDLDGTSTYSQVVNVEFNNTPTVYSLSQNFPNPFNPETSISFSLPKSEHVTLEVYDILGNRVSVLVNEVREVGTHTVSFNATALSSGVYLYKITAGNFNSSKKMNILK